MKKQGHGWVTSLLLILITALLQLSCGPKPAESAIEQVVPHIPTSSTFGPLYPRLNELLNSPGGRDVAAAARETRAWAEAHLQGFTTGSCATLHIVSDGEFTRIFGRTTLGVTLPWMQIYIRDGKRDPDPFLWQDASMFVSTVLHEYVHAIQRAQQASRELGATDCDTSRRVLALKQGVWTAGFETLRTNAQLGNGYDGHERALLYHWASPIERARDEVEAALLTVEWMDKNPDELNAYTLGGANNWAYALQFLNQLKALSTSNCYSPDDTAYQEEQKIFSDEVPRYLSELQTYENGMRALLRQQNTPALNLELRELRSTATPTGRMGAACNNAALTQLPQFPADHGIRPDPLHIE